MDQLIEHIDQNTRSFAESFGGLSAEQLNWKQNPETWSIAQNIRHIIAMNETYFDKIAEIKHRAGKKPFIARFDFIVNFMGNAIAQYAQADRKKRTKTFKLWNPAKSDFTATILADFERHQEEFKDQIKQAIPLVEQCAIIQSPATNLLYYKLEKALTFLVSHEERHFNQAEEVLEQMSAEKR